MIDNPLQQNAFQALVNQNKNANSDQSMVNWDPNSNATANAPHLAGNLIAGMGQNLKNQQGFYNSLQPLQNQLTTHLLNLFGTQGGNASLIGANASQVNAQGEGQLAQTLARIRAGGGGIGTQQGAMINQSNQDNSANNDFIAHINSPAGQQAINQFLQSLIQGAAPQTQQLAQLSGVQNPNPGGGGNDLMSGLFSVLGGAASAGKLFGI